MQRVLLVDQVSVREVYPLVREGEAIVDLETAQAVAEGARAVVEVVAVTAGIKILE